jgi:acetyl esterase/lipase
MRLPATLLALTALSLVCLGSFASSSSRAGVATTAPLPQAAATQPSTAPTFTRKQDVVYFRTYGTALTMDVFTPTDRPPNGAAVIAVVSGGWVSSHDAIGVVLIGGFVRPFLDRGYTVLAVAPGSQPKFTIPEIASHIDRAVHYIRGHASELKIDRNRLGIFGGSAGGHLSLLQATSPTPAKNKLGFDKMEQFSGEVQAAAVFFPPTDFLNWGEPNVNVLDAPLIKPFRAAFDFEELSGQTGRFEPVGDKNRVRDILRKASPVYHVTKQTPPTLIIHGDKDLLVPLQQGQVFIDKLKEVGVPGELYVKGGAGHGWAPIKPEMERCADWFDKHLAPKD